jgi:hypothetical protein
MQSGGFLGRANANDERTMVIRPPAAAATSRRGVALPAVRPWPRNGVLAATTRELVAAMIVDAIDLRLSGCLD